MVNKSDIPKKFAVGFQEGTCQLSCNKCAAFGKYAVKKKKAGRMELSVAKKLIDEIAVIGGTQIQPSIFTEPFANKDLKEIILYCNEKSIGLNIITNGILIDDEWIEFIINNMKSNSTISFSLDAVKQSTYEIVRGNYDLGKLEETVHKLITKRKNNNPRITVSFTMEEDNKDEKDEFVEKWKYIADVVRVTICWDKDRKIPKQYKTNEIEEYKPCTRILDDMTIDYNGEVRVCQVDAFGESNLGNVFEEGILNVWNGVKSRKIRERHCNQQLLETDYCYGCEAGKVIVTEEQETDEFFIKRGPYVVYYNKKTS